MFLILHAHTYGGKIMQLNNLKIKNCVRCGHCWASRLITNPSQCPNCHCKRFDIPVRVKLPQKEVGPVGRPHKYPVHLLNINQHMTIPFGTEAGNISAKQSIAAYGIRSGRRFKIKASPAGMVVTRIM